MSTIKNVGFIGLGINIHMNTIYQPYTYLVGWKQHQKYYYGVRYAKDCNPADLWVKYFTSSKEVKLLRKLYGEPNVKEIRKTFTDRKDAIIWETKVLQRMKVIKRDDFLNKNDAPAPPINNRIMSDDTKKKISKIHKGKFKSEITKQKIREARAKQDMSWRKGIPLRDETKQKIREKRALQQYSDSARLKMKNHRANGKLIGLAGKHHSLETKKKLSDINKGRKLSDDHRKKISDAFKNKPVLTCPHCGNVGKSLSMTRHHFDNCKHKKG